MGTGGLFLRKVRATWADRPTGFVWVEENRIAASGYPASKDQLLWLCGQGIRSILTLTENPLPSSWLQGMSLEARHVAMVDHDPPSVQNLDEAARFIDAQVKAGRPVVVHCLAGQGRTMCAIAAYLILTKGEGPVETIERLRRIRSGAVEHGQEKSLEAYASKVRGKAQ
jgi:atypical dual specificity phosphatase